MFSRSEDGRFGDTPSQRTRVEIAAGGRNLFQTTSMDRLQGAFYGGDHAEAGDVFTKDDDIFGSFGAKRH